MHSYLPAIPKFVKSLFPLSEPGESLPLAQYFNPLFLPALRIRVVYPGSGSWIPGPGSNKYKKEAEEQNSFCLTFL
jgi:hypothetical protein